MRLSQSVGLGIRVVATFVLAMCAAGAASAQEASDELWGTPTYLDDVIISGAPVQRGGEDMARWEDIWAAIYDADLPASADSDSPLPSDRPWLANPIVESVLDDAAVNGPGVSAPQDHAQQQGGIFDYSQRDPWDLDGFISSADQPSDTNDDEYELSNPGNTIAPIEIMPPSYRASAQPNAPLALPRQCRNDWVLFGSVCEALYDEPGYMSLWTTHFDYRSDDGDSELVAIPLTDAQRRLFNLDPELHDPNPRFEEPEDPSADINASVLDDDTPYFVGLGGGGFSSSQSDTSQTGEPRDEELPGVGESVIDDTIPNNGRSPSPEEPDNRSSVSPGGNEPPPETQSLSIGGDPAQTEEGGMTFVGGQETTFTENGR